MLYLRTIYIHAEGGKYETRDFTQIKTDAGWVPGIYYISTEDGKGYARTIENFTDRFTIETPIDHSTRIIQVPEGEVDPEIVKEMAEGKEPIDIMVSLNEEIDQDLKALEGKELNILMGKPAVGESKLGIAYNGEKGTIVSYIGSDTKLKTQHLDKKMSEKFMSDFGQMEDLLTEKQFLAWLDKNKPVAAKTKGIIPETIEEAYPRMEEILDWAVKEFKEMREELAVARTHHGLGNHIRNEWALHKGPSPLRDWFKQQGIHHPDDMSGMLIKCYHRHLNGQEIDLNEMIASYRNYWVGQGKNPDNPENK